MVPYRRVYALKVRFTFQVARHHFGRKSAERFHPCQKELLLIVLITGVTLETLGVVKLEVIQTVVSNCFWVFHSIACSPPPWLW